MKRILDIFDAVHKDPLSELFFSQDPIEAGALPIGIPEAMGGMARTHFCNAMSIDAIPRVVLSRLLFGHDQSVAFARSYDPTSLIVGYGNEKVANAALQAKLAYVQVSEKLAGKWPIITQYTRHCFTNSSNTKTMAILSNDVRPKSIPNSITWGVDADYTTSAIDNAANVIREVLLNLRMIKLSIDDNMTTNEVVWRQQLESGSLSETIIRWERQNIKILQDWKNREILMLGFLRMLGPNAAFVVIPNIFNKRLTYYTWAGLWAVIDIEGVDIETEEFADKLYTLNFIAQELMAEIQGYTDRLKMWQRRMLADHRDIYESFLAYEFLPRSLGRIDLITEPPLIKCPGFAYPINLRKFFPQVPFHEPSNKLVLDVLAEVLNVHRSSVSSRERRVIQSVLHDLQPGKIATVSKLPSDKFTRDFESLRHRLRWIAPDVIHRDDANTATTEEARKELLDGIREQVKPLLDVREYLRRTLATILHEKGVQARTVGDKLLYYEDFDYDLSQRTDFLNWTWSDLCRRYADRNGIENLPFPIHYLDRTFEALVHNFEKYAAPGETCALRAVENDNNFCLQWSVSGGPAPFKDFEEFGRKVVEPLLSSDPKGINRGLPLSLTFGLETGAKRIDVWLKGDSKLGAWHRIFGNGDDHERLDAPTFAIRWMWNLTGGNARP